MAGIYIHIPFCHQKCSYCDFYSVIGLDDKKLFIEVLIKEIELQKDYLNGETIDSIYFGGGTPSVLDVNDIDLILNTLNQQYTIGESPEITLEANPDDLSQNYLSELNKIAVNRLSIGIQSFYDDHLKFLNRRHNSDQAIKSVEYAKKAGFTDISIDLIYGIPNMSFGQWKNNIDKVIQLKVEHISAYHLTIEPNTVFNNMLKEGKLKEINEEVSWEQYSFLVNELIDEGFEQYEISNFAKNQNYSKHNTSYWQQKKYLGLGPSAHSYNQVSRQWNTKKIKEYIEKLQNNKLAFEREELDLKKQFNDYIITGLRTKWGIDLEYIKDTFGEKYYNHCRTVFSRLFYLDSVELTDKRITLTKRGYFISNSIFEEFILV